MNKNKTKCQLNLLVYKEWKELLDKKAREISFLENRDYSTVELCRDILVGYISGSIKDQEGEGS